MNLNKNTLANALMALGKYVSRTSPVEMYRSVLIENKNNKLTLSTRNLEEVLEFSMESEGLPDFQKLVNFDVFRNVVRNGRNKELVLELNDHGLLIVDGTEFCDVPCEVPDVPETPTYAASDVLPEDFVSMLAQAAPLVNRNEPRRILQGIHLSAEGLTATNGKELFHIPRVWNLPDLTLPLPLALMATKAAAPGQIFVWQKEQTTYFKVVIQEWSWTGKALAGIFPNWKSVMPDPTNLKYGVKLDPDRAQHLLNFLKGVPDDLPNNAIDLSMGSDHASLDVESRNGSKTSIIAEFNTDWDDFTVSTNRDYLIRLFQQGHTTLEFSCDHAPFRATGGVGEYVTMPLVPKQKPIQTQQEESKMENTNNTVVAVTIPPVANNPITPEPVILNPLDDLAAAVDEFKTKIRSMFDESTVLARKVKEVALAQKQKERDFIQAKRAIERIRMAI